MGVTYNNRAILKTRSNIVENVANVIYSVVCNGQLSSVLSISGGTFRKTLSKRGKKGINTCKRHTYEVGPSQYYSKLFTVTYEPNFIISTFNKINTNYTINADNIEKQLNDYIDGISTNLNCLINNDLQNENEYFLLATIIFNFLLSRIKSAQCVVRNTVSTETISTVFAYFYDKNASTLNELTTIPIDLADSIIQTFSVTKLDENDIYKDKNDNDISDNVKKYLSTVANLFKMLKCPVINTINCQITTT